MITTFHRLIDCQDPAGSLAFQWLTDFVARPHPLTGRPSPVCPNLAEAFDREVVLCTTIKLAMTEGDERRPVLEALLEEVGQEFLHHLDSVPAGPDKILNCAVALIDGIEPHEYRHVLEGAFRAVRPKIIATGLMFGCFHPYYNRSSRLNPTFYSMRSPGPMVAYRVLLKSDIRSLSDDQTWVEAYHLVFRGNR